VLTAVMSGVFLEDVCKDDGIEGSSIKELFDED